MTRPEPWRTWRPAERLAYLAHLADLAQREEEPETAPLALLTTPIPIPAGPERVEPLEDGCVDSAREPVPGSYRSRAESARRTLALGFVALVVLTAVLWALLLWLAS